MRTPQAKRNDQKSPPLSHTPVNHENQCHANDRGEIGFLRGCHGLPSLIVSVLLSNIQGCVIKVGTRLPSDQGSNTSDSAVTSGPSKKRTAAPKLKRMVWISLNCML